MLGVSSPLVMTLPLPLTWMSAPTTPTMTGSENSDVLRALPASVAVAVTSVPLATTAAMVALNVARPLALVVGVDGAEERAALDGGGVGAGVAEELDAERRARGGRERAGELRVGRRC